MNRIVRFYFLVVLIVLAGPACGVGYILSSSYYQFELLALREPIVKARLRGTLTRSQLSALNTIQRAREYGSTLGFKVSNIYTTVATDWGREMWNVSACDSLRFRPKQWWFPVVGNVPYLGFLSNQNTIIGTTIIPIIRSHQTTVVHGELLASNPEGYVSSKLCPSFINIQITSIAPITVRLNRNACTNVPCFTIN